MDTLRHSAYKEIAAAEELLKDLKPGKRHDEARGKIHELSMRCEQWKKDAERLSRRRQSIENNKLPGLSTALAQMRTRLMEPITTDPAVVIG